MQEPEIDVENNPDERNANTETPDENVENKEAAQPSEKKEKPARKKKGLSGAYWYSVKDDAELLKNSQIRTLIHVIALMLQLVVLFALHQAGLEYAWTYFESYTIIYAWAVLIMFAVSVYVIIMDCVRNKIRKRIPKERAPKNGFKRRAFFTAELDMAINALILIFEISFVCMYFNVEGLIGVFLTAAATGMSVWAREVERRTLKDAELVPAPDAEPAEGSQKD